MRSIGKIKIKKLKAIIKEEFDNAKNSTLMGFISDIDHKKLDQTVLDRVPDEWFDTWESAYTEIHNIIDDYTFELVSK